MTTSPTIAAARRILARWSDSGDELSVAVPLGTLRALLAETRGDEGFSSFGANAPSSRTEMESEPADDRTRWLNAQFAAASCHFANAMGIELSPGEARARNAKIAYVIGRVVPAGDDALLRAAKSAAAALNTARVLMETSGRWRNEAGFLTDAALWIDRAENELLANMEPGE